MALRQIQSRQTTLHPAPGVFRKTVTTTGLNRPALGNVANKKQSTNGQGIKGKSLKQQQTSRPVAKQPDVRAKVKPTTAGHTHTTTTLPPGINAQTSTQPDTEMIPAPCEPMSPKSRPTHERSATPPQPMDVSEVAGALQRKLNLEDKDHSNPQFCSEYAQDIYNYLGQLEEQYQPNSKYMSLQPHINYKMRAILIDWLILVQIKFNLLPETLYLSVSIIDRFLEVFPTTKDKLQLVGVTAMLIASKYEEIYFPQVSDFVYITDHSYSEEEIRAMERVILKTIGYSLGNPASIHFLRRFSKLNQVNSRTHTMAKFFLELSLVSYHMLSYLPSEVAASALYLARRVLSAEKPFCCATEYYGHYTEDDLQPCCSQLATLIKGMSTSKQQAVREKYSNSKFLSVAKEPALFGTLIQQLAAQRKAV